MFLDLSSEYLNMNFGAVVSEIWILFFWSQLLAISGQNPVPVEYKNCRTSYALFFPLQVLELKIMSVGWD
jgi:hypothetical protein